MSLNGVIAAFATGTYTVTRYETETYTKGRRVEGASSTFSIVAVVVPMSGRVLNALATAQETEETRRLATTTELRARTPESAPDMIEIDGEEWQVTKVERSQHWGATHYVVTCERQRYT